MLRRLDLRGTSADDLRSSLPRPEAAKEPPVAAVQAILADVRARGDQALREYTERFDGVALDAFRVPQAELDEALATIPPLLREALDAARASILAYHREQLHEPVTHQRDGVLVREIRIPVD
ncbi:MAG: histidinol dehydrogenase, partial [Actinobacteria bacterium]|nr:histidinol dehydrogenase [Actinomycetota bacterium]